MTSDEFAGMIASGQQPWKTSWSDSSKEQYFHFLNAEQANELELQRWRLNNEYNTPYNQMARMIEAGINPAAAYQSVSSGNSSSPANVHQSGTAAFHDTSDQLQRVNTIMNGITSIMSTIKTGVDAVEGIQGVQFGYQNNWYDAMRANYARGSGQSTLWLGDSDDAKHMDRPIEVAPGLYMDGTAAQLFPELREGMFAGGNYNIAAGNRKDQHAIAERRTRIDQLIQNIFHGLETNASSAEMMRMFLELFAYSAISKFGGY